MKNLVPATGLAREIKRVRRRLSKHRTMIVTRHGKPAALLIATSERAIWI